MNKPESTNEPQSTPKRTCSSCNGCGFHNWAGDEMCQQCNGTGEMNSSKEPPYIATRKHYTKVTRKK